MKNDNILLIDKLSENKTLFVRDGAEKTFIICLIDKKDQNDHRLSVIIKGKNAKVQILGLIIGQGKQKINLFTLQDHLVQNSVSDLLVKSVLFDSSKFYYEGLIKIEKNAQKSNAYQKNQNLLMSANAWADSRPKLEILANDVRCTHGVTIGKIDPEVLYYLKTRGLSEKQAEHLIIEGFFKDILDRIPDQKIVDHLTKKISKTVVKLLEIKN
ncbi:hypothetical protein A3D78_07720 [Candidatus Gottesmanbacteria bacterium RIFCSPHIGHO2_02_FULL_39_14]|uniref:SUF system FeS cluster assembly SufBD core domain-containing protein n=1 Tax=Candidatus Gottesmanbacteria bacterium RIFCSPHIGHO2_02_FULL_39_14 TaxID=1798383 RepID=A0A1F5ZW64_9BACT|nr:MAG: hypothetical protein A3D78_07720 [Candidatus Gottesmanbacteria bacterium RIFCSPHIGHO2_02_FULL_39_14]